MEVKIHGFFFIKLYLRLVYEYFYSQYYPIAKLSLNIPLIYLLLSIVEYLYVFIEKSVWSILLLSYSNHQLFMH